MQFDLFSNINIKQNNNEQLLTDLFQAYYKARKNKRNTISQLKFEINYEHNIFELYNEIIENRYKPKQSICFIVNKPVQREVFAANFRDRVVHHLIFNYISPIFEKIFINDSYSCRKKKGTHYGIKRINKFISSCSQNYTEDCYILKLDIKGYFMAMDKNILYQKVKTEIAKRKDKIDFNFDIVLSLIEKTIFNDPTKNCIIKGKKLDWKGLPKTKSLFYANENYGLPIGNLTSQLFGNVYMNDFDHFVKKSCGIKYYGRYVDDFVLIHPDKEYLKKIIPVISDFLQTELKLTLHPKKIYLQHFTKGIKYLGAVIKPYRIYTASRTKGNFYKTMQKWNKYIENKPNKELSKPELKLFISSINSYLGISRQFSTYKMRKTMILQNMSQYFWKYVYLCNNNKLRLKTKTISFS